MCAATQLVLFETGLNLAALRETREGFMQAHRSANTVRAYDFAWGTFEAWCSRAGRDSLPATSDTVTLFATARIHEGRRLATVNLALAAISDKHYRAALPSPVDKSVRELLTNAARKLQEQPAGKAAVTPRQLLRISRLLRFSPCAIESRDRALLLLGFAAGWRASELARLEYPADVKFTKLGVALWQRRSKNDQAGKGRLIGVPFGAEEETCPVRALKDWLHVRGGEPGSLFCRVSSAGTLKVGCSLGTQQVSNRVKFWLERIRVDPKLYGSHSLRAGNVTAATEAGATLAQIMGRTGHKSIATVMRYIRPAEIFRTDPLAGVL